MSTRVVLAFIITVIFTLVSSITYYLLKHILLIVPTYPGLKIFVIAAFAIAAYGFLLGRIIERFWISWVTDSLIWLGSLYLAFGWLCFWLFLGLDIVQGLGHLFHYPLPSSIELLSIKVIILTVTILMIVGFIQANTTRIKKLDITIQKKSPLPNQAPTLKLVVVTDIHLGTIIGRRHVKKLNRLIEKIDPAILLLPGDVVDEDIRPVIRQDLGELLKSLHPTYGTYSVTGNHEYIGGVEHAVKYLQEHNIRVLRDEWLEVCGLQIVGREDISSRRFTLQKRKSLDEILVGIDFNKPVILLDHQPSRLNEAQSAGVDLQLSGHTHHGQMWPISLLTKRIFEVSWGYLRKGKTQYYVSCGFGSWGPPIRLGSHSEIIELNLHFNA